MPPLDPPPAPRGRDRRVVLVIEDDDDSREMLRVVLSSMQGHEVHVADTGRAGVAMAAEVRPHVVFADIRLADLDGYKVAAEVRATLGPAVRLVALTGHRHLEDRAAFDAHLVKPVSPDQLAAQVALAPCGPAAASRDDVHHVLERSLNALAHSQAQWIVTELRCGRTLADIAATARSDERRRAAWEKAGAALRTGRHYRARMAHWLTRDQAEAIDRLVLELEQALRDRAADGAPPAPAAQRRSDPPAMP
jgi:CheY-like chemotaxis protein